MPAEKSLIRKIAAASIVAAGACLVTGVYVIGTSDKSATECDFIQYWAAERQLIRGANPYDIEEILHLEQATGMQDSVPKISLSPPVAFFFALPLGYLRAKTALILWQLILLGTTGVSAGLLWMIYGRRQTRLHLLAFAFPPTLSCLMAGQLGTFFLFGIVLFLYLHKSRPWLAGVALMPCALKPHLFLPCIVVLALWSAMRRQPGVIGGFLLALAASCGLTLSVDTSIWSQYRLLMQSAHMMDVFLPTVGVALRFAIDRQDKWIEFVPAALGCAWSAWFYWTRRECWEWTDQGMLVLLVSVACSPYSWFSDQALLFPAVLAGMFAAGKGVWRWVLLGLIAAACAPGLIFAIPLPSPYYVWTAVAWLVWYLLATWHRREAAILKTEMAAVSE